MGKNHPGFRRIDEQVGHQKRHLVELEKGKQAEHESPHEIGMTLRTAFRSPIKKTAGDGYSDEEQTGAEKYLGSKRRGIG